MQLLYSPWLLPVQDIVSAAVHTLLANHLLAHKLLRVAVHTLLAKRLPWHSQSGIIAPTFRKHLIRNESSAAQADYWRNQSRNKTSQLRRNFGDGESSDDCMSLDSGDRFKEKGIKDPETGRPVIPRSCYPALWLWAKSRSV